MNKQEKQERLDQMVKESKKISLSVKIAIIYIAVISIMAAVHFIYLAVSH